MGITSYDEGYSIRRVLMWIFLFWILSNHVVRGISASALLSSGGQSASQIVGTPDFIPNIQRIMLVPWNRFRLHLGSTFISYGNYCPESARVGCIKTVEVLNVVLGLHV